MDKIVPAARRYSWGSRTLIPELVGSEPSGQPLAELWYGAHPGDPSTIAVTGARLDEVIDADPRSVAPWAGGLPFLMKILAADDVLSLQAHPSPEQAAEGFARENALGIALDDAKRNYKDGSHKPEIIIALSPFYAMAGFRPLARTRELFAALECPELNRYLSMLSPEETPDAEEDNLRALFTTWITIPAAARRELIDAIVAAVPRVPEGWMSRVMDTVLHINEQYPGDIGVLGALLLNHIELAPGEAVYLDAGQLHAYVHGLGVEVMANSDNVLRGGLTPKYVDVPELVKVLKFAALEEPRVHPQQLGDGLSEAATVAEEYITPADEFTVDRYELPAGATGTLNPTGPAIALCTHGTVTLGETTLAPGEATWLPATDGPVAVTVDAAAAAPAQLFVARA